MPRIARSPRGSIAVGALALGAASAAAVTSGCRSDHQPDRALSHVSPLGPPRSGSGGSAGPGAPAPTAPAPPARPASPPAGTDRLVPVPAALAAGLELREVARGLARPVLLVAAPGDPRRRLFVLEQHAGRVRVIEGGVLAPRPFLELSGLSTGNEQGLLGLAFHPRFAETGRLYVSYTASDKDSHIVEYRVPTPDAAAVDPATRRELVEIDQPYSNHNGGHVQFGPDGKLYAGMGDGGSAGDPLRAGQDRRALLGKLLRLDVDAPQPTPEIVHLGLRNPWRFWFDEPSGGLYIADVGQNLWEYVFAVPAADGVQRNFGWSVVEGNHCFRARTCDRTGFTPPVADYPHEEGCSVTGGIVYRGSAIPALVGRYFYADYCTGLLRSFVWTPDRSSPTAPGWIREHWDWKAALDRQAVLSQVASFGTDHDGELYIVLLTGSIYRLAPRRP